MNRHSLAALAIVKKYGHMVQGGTTRPTLEAAELRTLFDYVLLAESTHQGATADTLQQGTLG